MGLSWGQAGVKLGSSWGQAGVNLGSIWGQPAPPYLEDAAVVLLQRSLGLRQRLL